MNVAEDLSDQGTSPEPEASERPSMLRAIRSPRFWLLAILFFGIFGSTISFQGLWATPFLVTAFHMDRVAASGLNMLIPIGFMLGAPLSGVLADRFFQNRANLAILLISIIVCMWILIVFIPTDLGASGMGLVFFVLGGTTGGMASTLWGAVRENAPAAFLGTTTGLLNVFPLFGMAVMQGVTGAILDRSVTLQGSYSAAGFQNAFLVCLGATVVCFFVCLWMRQSGKRLPQS